MHHGVVQRLRVSQPSMPVRCTTFHASAVAQQQRHVCLRAAATSHPFPLHDRSVAIRSSAMHTAEARAVVHHACRIYLRELPGSYVFLVAFSPLFCLSTTWNLDDIPLWGFTYKENRFPETCIHLPKRGTSKRRENLEFERQMPPRTKIRHQSSISMRAHGPWTTVVVPISLNNLLQKGTGVGADFPAKIRPERTSKKVDQEIS